jgi:site-specific DNA-methyltransferase (adenine-specific)
MAATPSSVKRTMIKSRMSNARVIILGSSRKVIHAGVSACRLPRNVARNFGSINDNILFYCKSQDYVWVQQYAAFPEEYIKEKFTGIDAKGRYQNVTLRNPGVRPNLRYLYTASNGVTYEPHPNGWSCDINRMQKYDREGRLHFPSKQGGQLRMRMYLDEGKGVRMQNIWDDIAALNSQAQERLGYPTQKPIALLERIISSSSNEDSVVLDPFCGCGTTIHAAQKLKRQWISIDITHLAISLIEKRLNDAFPGIQYEVHGTPKDMEGARALAAQDKYQFQWWAVSLVNAVPFGGKKKGADSGIDGLIYFKPEGKTTEKAIVSVKGGDNVNVAMVRDLAHVVDREKARIGVFITLAESTGPMRTEAIKAGFYETLYGRYPKIQILTMADLFSGKKPDIPLVDSASFKKATKEAVGAQDDLPFEDLLRPALA